VRSYESISRFVLFSSLKLLPKLFLKNAIKPFLTVTLMPDSYQPLIILLGERLWAEFRVFLKKMR